MRLPALLVAVMVGTGLGAGRAAAAHTQPAANAPVAEVRQTLAEARKEIYEIQHLSVGLPAPPVSGKPRNARQAISRESLRGKPVVLVFWGST